MAILISLFCAGLFVLAAIALYIRRHPEQTMPLTQNATDEMLQAAFDQGYYTGYTECSSNIAMDASVIERLGLADKIQIEAYKATMPAREQKI